MRVDHLDDAVLEALVGLAPVIHAKRADPAAPAASTLLLTETLTRQIIAFHGALELAVEAGEDGKKTVGRVQAAVQRAFRVGRELAVKYLGESRLTAREVEALLARQVSEVGELVQSAVMELRDAKAPETLVQDRLEGVASLLWGVGHFAFAKELEAAPVELSWLVTSADPCVDCVQMAEDGPFTALRPLPTVPGMGQTACRHSGCRCLLTVGRVEQKAAGGGRTASRLGPEPQNREVTAFKDLAVSLDSVAKALLRRPEPTVVQTPPAEVTLGDMKVEVAAPLAPEIRVDVHVPEAPKLVRRVVKTRFLRDAETQLLTGKEELIEDRAVTDEEAAAWLA